MTNKNLIVFFKTNVELDLATDFTDFRDFNTETIYNNTLYTLTLHLNKMPTTRADTQFENKIRAELSKVRDASRCKRVEITKGIFNLILTTSGITYVNKHPKFKKTIRLKLEDFYWEPEVKTDVIEWHMKIFKEPIWQIRQRYW